MSQFEYEIEEYDDYDDDNGGYYESRWKRNTLLCAIAAFLVASGVRYATLPEKSLHNLLETLSPRDECGEGHVPFTSRVTDGVVSCSRFVDDQTGKPEREALKYMPSPNSAVIMPDGSIGVGAQLLAKPGVPQRLFHNDGSMQLLDLNIILTGLGDVGLEQCADDMYRFVQYAQQKPETITDNKGAYAEIKQAENAYDVFPVIRLKANDPNKADLFVYDQNAVANGTSVEGARIQCSVA